jgi:hypothetical protein
VVNTSADLSAMRSFVLPIEKLRGRFVSIGAEVKAQGVSAKPQPWNGVKVMARIDAPSGTQWPQPEIGVGAFDWKRVSQRIRIPADATAVTLVLGLEKVSGTAWFDHVRITYIKELTPAAPAPADQPILRGHSLPRLRGAMIQPKTLSEADLRTFALDWGGNLVRWQLVRSNGSAEQNTPAAYDRWLDDELKKLDQGLAWAKAMGVMVVVDLHSPPGGTNSQGGYQAAAGGIFDDPSAQTKFVEVWQRLATRYKGEEQIWGFDLVNEPVDDSAAEGCDDWQALALRAGRAIREIDPSRTLIVEPPDGGGPDGFIGFAPVPLPRVVYSVHMYIPGQFTHQGVFSPSTPVKYPGMISGMMWDKAALERALSPAIDFAQRYRVHMYVGEFSAIRWAPGAESYLSDLIDIFEAHGWDWSYHAYREWTGWSVEYGADRMDTHPATQPTARERLLLKWLGQNRSPRI